MFICPFLLLVESVFFFRHASLKQVKMKFLSCWLVHCQLFAAYSNLTTHHDSLDSYTFYIAAASFFQVSASAASDVHVVVVTVNQQQKRQYHGMLGYYVGLKNTGRRPNSSKYVCMCVSVHIDMQVPTLGTTLYIRYDTIPYFSSFGSNITKNYQLVSR